MNPQSFVAGLIALQFVAFGWRINREIPLGDRGRRTWFPAPDWLNLVSLVSVVLMCVVVPLAAGDFGKVARTTLAVGYSLIAFHPISMAAHYRLFSEQGRWVYLKTRIENGKSIVDGDFPWMTGQEAVAVILSVVVASIVGCAVWRS